MGEIKAKWTGGLQFVATDVNRHALVMDAPVDSGGEGTGFKPSELLLVALAGCTGVDMVNILRRGRHEVTGVEVTATSEQAKDPPWPFETIRVEYVVKGRSLKDEVVKRAIDLSEEKYCSVGATVSGKAKIISSFRIENVE